MPGDEVVDSSRRRSTRLSRCATLGTALLCLSIPAQLLGGQWWLFDLFNHLRMQILWGAILLLVSFLIARRWRGAIFVGILLIVQFWLYASALTDGRPVSVSGELTGEKPLRILSLNVWSRNREYDRVIELIQEESPDVIVLEELDEGWRGPIEALRKGWPHGKRILAGGHLGIALLSRLPLENVRIERISGEIPVIVARVSREGEGVSICGVHLTRPTSRRGAERQREQYAALIGLFREEPPNRILIGDFNATPWSHPFARFCTESELHNAREGIGLLPSWPAFLPAPLRIPIDHCLVSPAIRVQDVHIGPAVGSDHLPVIVDLSFQADSPL